MTLKAFVTATIIQESGTDNYQIGVGANIDLSNKTDEELGEIGTLLGAAYTRLLIKAREGELPE